ncbi:hypothetical protein BH11PSE8_BH11PSE8_15050 [soil metagenome]
MSSAEPDDGRPPRRAGLVIVGLVLAAVLCAVGYVQWRQHRLLGDTTQFQNDALSWSFSQLETEHLRLENRIDMALRNPAPDDAEQLQTRYDIFVSRIGLVDHDRARKIMAGHASFVPAMAQVKAFVAAADRYLGPTPNAPLTPDAMRELLAGLNSLDVPLHDLSLGASHLLYERAAQRNALVRQQSQLSIALTASQCFLLLAMAAIVVRQLRALTERRRRLEALATSLSQARVEAESASRAKSVFLANMSHEIRTPFHGLLGMMSLLQDTRLTVQQSGFLNTAKESAHHLLEILNDILDVSKLESGKLQMTTATVDLLQLVSQVDALMRVQAQAKNLTLRFEVAPDVPRWVRADATRVKQILFNLLSNAVKFSTQGTVRLNVSDRGAGLLAFVVADTGIGMDAATLGLLFQRFVQGDDSTSRLHAGTGLGLEISRNLARLMGGDIAVASIPGVGSTFTVVLPLPSVGPPLADPQALPTDGIAQQPRLRVLVAEDHPVNRAYMEAVLDKLGHEAVFSDNGEGAVRALQAQEFDIVLMDLHMPVMDGFAAARAMRAMPPPRGSVPIVALTADAFQESRDLAHQAGMNAFLTKPAHLPQLREALQRYAGRHDAPSAIDAKASTDTPLAMGGAAAGSDADAHIDHATVQDVCNMLSPGRYGELLAHFFDSHDSTLADMRRAVSDERREALRAAAHSLKGAALSLGLRSVADTAQKLQTGRPQLTAAELMLLLDSLDSHLTTSLEICRRLQFLPPAPHRLGAQSERMH